MAKVTIMVEGEAAEIPGALQDLLDAFGVGHTVEAKQGENGVTVLEPWTGEQVQRVWDSLAPGAKPILAEIAKHPSGCSFHTVRQALGLQGLTVAGRLSSLGFALKRLGFTEGKPAFLDRDWNTDTYHMDPGVSEALRQIAASNAS